MGRPPREIKRINVTVRFEPSEMAWLDATRGTETRQNYIHRNALRGPSCGPVAPPPKPAPSSREHKTMVVERPRALAVAVADAADRTGVHIGPIRPAPGSRLKGNSRG